MIKLVCQLVLPYCHPQDTLALSRTSHYWRAIVRDVYHLGALLDGLIRTASLDGYKQLKLYRVIAILANTAAARRYVYAIDPVFYDALTYVINRHLPPQKIFPVMLMLSPGARLHGEYHQLTYQRHTLTLWNGGMCTDIACMHYDGNGLYELSKPWFLHGQQVTKSRKDGNTMQLYLDDNITIVASDNWAKIKLRRTIPYNGIPASTSLTIISILIALTALMSFGQISIGWITAAELAVFTLLAIMSIIAINLDKPPSSRPQTYRL